MNIVVLKWAWTSVAEKLQSDWTASIVAAEQIQVAIGLIPEPGIENNSGILGKDFFQQ